MKHKYKILNESIDFDEYVDILNPTTNEVLGQVPALSKVQVGKIYEFAKQTQKSWNEKTVSQRAYFLNEWANLMEKNKEDLANALVKEIAKNYNDALSEVIRTVEYIRYTVEEMYRLNWDVQTSEQFYQGKKNKIAITKNEPMGVILVISPFNYPINLSVAKIAPAIISGNTVVFKPATQGSIVATKLIKLLEETNIEAGVVNLVTGRGRDIGDYLVEHPNINFVNFTGGTTTGMGISQKLSLIPQIMELGGKDPALVLDDANLEKAAQHIIKGAFSYSGQRCTAIKRVLVSEKNKEKLEQILLDKIKQVSVGLPEDNNMVTPLIDKHSVNYLNGLIEDLNPNAKILFGNQEAKGNLFYPTLVTNVLHTDRLAVEEQFGPILPIITYKTLEEALEIINESEFALQASIFGNDWEVMFNLANKMEAGSVNFNSASSRGPDNFPFSGHKKSGVGIQGIRNSIKSMTKQKTIVLNFS